MLGMSGVVSGPVVVGIDGSVIARSAARWAAEEAVRRGVGLRIVYADVFALPALPELPGLPWPKEHRVQVRTQVEQWLGRAADLARQDCPDVVVDTEERAGRPEPVLIDESRSAGLVVVGDRGLGGFAGLLAGSVAATVAAHAHCPTAVVRGSDESGRLPSTGPVVVGIEGVHEARGVLAHAFDAAAARGVALHVVHTWHLVGVDPQAPVSRMVVQEDVRAREERLVSEVLAGWTEQYPDVQVHRFVGPGSPATVLLEHADSAQLVVVGSRGRGGFSGLLLGSTSQALIHHASCPVVVVRDRTT